MHYSIIALGNYKEYIGKYREFDGDNLEVAKHISKLTEAKIKYENMRVEKYVTPEGVIVDDYDPILYRRPTPEEARKIGRCFGFACGSINGKEYVYRRWEDNGYDGLRFLNAPKEYIKKELTYSQFMSFPEFCQQWYGYPVVHNKKEAEDSDNPFGYILTDEKGEVRDVIQVTNPDGHYDYYEVGGRFIDSVRNNSNLTMIKGLVSQINIFNSQIFGVVTPHFWKDKYQRVGFRDESEYWKFKETCVWDEELKDILSQFQSNIRFTLLDCHS